MFMPTTLLNLKIMKKLLFIFNLCLTFSLLGQGRKLSIGVASNGILIPKTANFAKFSGKIYTINVAREFTIQYKLNKSFSIGSSFSFWKNALNSNYSNRDITIFNYKAFDTLSLLPHIRTKYKYFDIYTSYDLLKYKKSNLYFTFGLTFAQGKNDYLKKLVLSTDPNFIDIIYAGYEQKSEKYFGIVGGMGYGINLFRDRISIGINSNLRLYSKYPVHINYGLYLKCNI